MIDNEIIKALERTASWVCDECKFHGEMCDGDKCEKVVAENALDLITRQKSEIERLQESGKEAVSCFTRMESLYKIKCKELEVAKSEAIKEFAERLKEKLQWDVEFDNKLVFESDIDNLVNKMEVSE